MNKNKKVALLKGIAAGTRSISELQPLQIKHWHKKDGVYTLEGMNLNLTEEEFDYMEKKDSNVQHIVHVYSDVPIAEREEDVMV